jgi:hypothetical protein
MDMSINHWKLRMNIMQNGLPSDNKNNLAYDFTSDYKYKNKPYDIRVLSSIESVEVQGNGPLVTIKGHGFSSDISKTQVKFGELPCQITVGGLSADKIQCNVVHLPKSQSSNEILGIGSHGMTRYLYKDYMPDSIATFKTAIDARTIQK